MKRMSNFKFRVILIPIVAFFVVACLIGTIVANMYSGALDWQLGMGEKHIVQVDGVSEEDTEYYAQKYQNSEEAMLASAEASALAGDEGEVLLKNIGGTLPLKKGAAVTPFGYRYIEPVYGGTGSGKVDASKEYVVTAEEALHEYFTVNQTVERKLKTAPVQKLSGEKVAGRDDSGYNGADERIHNFDANIYAGTEDSCKGTAGIVFIGRNGGEGGDLFRDSTGYYDGTRHYLALTQNEKATIEFAKQHCDKVIVIINSSSAMELAELQNEPGVGAILWVGSTGARGEESMAKILCGEVNPSGKTVDIWAADFFSDPVYPNFGGSEFSDLPSLAQNYVNDFVEYEEGIYVGYRYYETRHAVDDRFSVFGETKPYDAAVVYPFGFGLNYEDDLVTQKLTDVRYAGGTVTVTGVVENNSSRDVKEVVQVYYGAPYHTSSKIEKSAKVLAAFDKIEVKAGESEEFVLSFSEQDMASYDHKGYYTQGAGSYVLEEGMYNIYLAKDSHECWGSQGIEVPQTLVYADAAANGGVAVGKRDSDEQAASNLFNDVNSYVESGTMTVMSRADFSGTYPSAPAPKQATDAIRQDVGAYDVDTDPISGNGEGSVLYRQMAPVSKEDNGILLSSLRGAEYDDPLWEELLNNIDYESEGLQELITYGFYSTAALEELGKVATLDRDGPVGLTAGGTNALVACTWMCMPIVAATWNTDIAYLLGESIGQEALSHGVNGWYAPGLNLHRSPFGGRVFEYFSEDPVVSGKMGAGVVSGAQQQGLVTYMKHFALNDQETNRITLTTWADEQTMREIYFKAFEICVKEATYELTYYDVESGAQKTVTRPAATALMSGMNSIGAKFCGTNYALLTQLLRGEWGFCGMVITDMTLPNEFKSIDEAYRVGNDVWMYMLVSDVQFDTPTAQWAVRAAVHNICYAVVNSSAYNKAAPGAYIYYDIAPWKIALIAINAVIYAGALTAVAWIVFRTVDEKKHPEKYQKKDKQ